MEVLSQDLVEEILKRVSAKALGRLKCVSDSKQWKSTIESKSFQEKQLIHRQQSIAPDVLFLHDPNAYFRNNNHSNYISPSSSVTVVMFASEKLFICSTSCDGLVCLYKRKYVNKSNIVMNPTTRWQRTFPPSKLQQQRRSRYQLPNLGFGKDKFNGTYKIVWLYNNSREFSLPEATKTSCEVFDFSTNAWRYVTPASPYEIITTFNPAYVDGSLHWFTKCQQTKVLSFNLHTETFQVIAKAPFVHVHREIRDGIIMRNMNNRLCVSDIKRSNEVIIWSFDSYCKTWNIIYSIDYNFLPTRKLSPVAVFEEKNRKMKILFYESLFCRDLVIYDGQTQSYDLEFKSKFYGFPVCYFQSLISI